MCVIIFTETFLVLSWTFLLTFLHSRKPFFYVSSEILWNPNLVRSFQKYHRKLGPGVVIQTSTGPWNPKFWPLFPRTPQCVHYFWVCQTCRSHCKTCRRVMLPATDKRHLVRERGLPESRAQPRVQIRQAGVFVNLCTKFGSSHHRYQCHPEGIMMRR